MQWFHSRRKLKNIKYTKKYQIRYYGLWFIISIFLIFVLSISTYWLFEGHWQSLLLQNPNRSLDYIFSKSHFISSLVMVSLILVIAITCLGIVSAHRVAGPLIALQKAFEEVKNGNRNYRVKFRKQDEMSDIESKFNEMMDSLQNPPK